ncbi:MAG TPA: hypothetical protein VLU25_08275, partial [Acidobacteriota bacterium]|nr:hypothetical protein [Acidobacteriota bacterium]
LQFDDKSGEVVGGLEFNVDLVPEPEVYKFYFPQFATGSGFTTRIVLINPGEEDFKGTLRLRDDDGKPLKTKINGRVVGGETSVEVPALGRRELRSDAGGELQVGSVSLASDGPLSGVVIYGSDRTGYTGVSASAALENGFSTSVEQKADSEVRTGIAIMNLEDASAALDLQLFDKDGLEVSQARLEIVARGHVARFLDEFGWSNGIGLSDFEGVLVATASARTAAIALLSTKDRLTVIPVVPR